MSAHADTTAYGVTIPANHPRLFWTPARVAQAQAWWATHSFTPSGSDQFAMLDYLLAYEATGNATYCTTAINTAMGVSPASCASPSNAGCDTARWWGEAALLTYDWCYSQMSASQRSTFVSNWNTWLMGISQQGWGGVGSSQSNYYFGNLRNEIEWGIGSYPENSATADALLKDGLQTRYQNDFVPASVTAGKGAGGLALEGGEYGPYQSYYAAIPLSGVTSMGRDVWNETTYWKGTVLNRIYMTPPQPTSSNGRSGWDVFPFSDDQNWQNGGPAEVSYVGNFMSVAANQWGNVGIGKFARQWLNMVNPSVDRIIQAVDAGGGTPAMAFSNLPLDYFDPGPRFMAGRNNWTANATAYLWQMGDHYSDGHNHDDWGTFQIHRKGKWLTRETPSYGETVAGYGGSSSQGAYTGYAHNVPFINGSAGINVQGGSDNYNAPPNVRRLESQTGYAYADVDLTGVYRNDQCCSGHPERGNPAAVHVEREYFFIRDIETTLIFDRLQSDTAARSKTFVFHCETNPTAVDANHVNCINGNQQLYVTTLLPATPSSRSIFNEKMSVAQNNQYRVEINDLPGATQSYTLHVLQAMDTAGTAVLTPTLVDSSPGTPASGILTVRLDANHSLVLAKGMSSSGGSITLNGQTTNLATTVQAISITDAGPVWAGSVAPPASACDLNGDSATNVSDVQLCVNQAIGTVACSTGDINQDATCNVIDVQRSVNAALGGQCVTQ
jgi:hypothetical protein